MTTQTVKLNPTERLSSIQRKKITIQSLLSWNSCHDTKYEYNKGEIIKKDAIKQTELHILRNLNKQFRLTDAYQNGGMLVAEVNCVLSAQIMRIPDIAFFTEQQINDAAKGTQVIPTFVVEIISKTDNVVNTENKKNEYFAAGVLVVWHIFPDAKCVYCYTSPETVSIVSNEKICSAEAAIKGLSLSTQALFAI